MTEKKEEKEIVKLIITCPIKGLKQGSKIDPKQYIHEKCGTELMIGLDGKISCSKCNIREPLNRWKFIESNEKLEVLPEKEDIPPKEVPVLAVNIATSLLKDAGINWVNKFLMNYKEEKR